MTRAPDVLLDIPLSTEPFELEGGPAGVLLVHGWTGSPLQVRPLGHHLHREGYSVRGIRLPGHGTSVEDLARRRWQEWQGTVERAWRSFRTAHQPAALLGYSMGGMLCALAAAEQPPAALVMLSSPYRIQIRDWRVHFLPLFKWLTPYVAEPYQPPDTEWAPYYRPLYDRVSTHAVHEILKLSAVVRRALPRVRAPALLLHGALDETVPPANLDWLAGALGGPVERHLFPRSGHELPVGDERLEVWARVSGFLDRHLRAR